MKSKDIQRLIVEQMLKTPQTDFNNDTAMPWDIYKRAYQDVQLGAWNAVFALVQDEMRPYQGPA